MSNEQSFTPQPDQAQWYGQESPLPGEKTSFRNDDLESIAIYQARQAIAKAISVTPSGQLEVIPAAIEQVRRTGWQEIAQTSLLTVKMRKAYGLNRLDLYEEDQSDPAIFSTGPGIADNTEQDTLKDVA